MFIKSDSIEHIGSSTYIDMSDDTSYEGIENTIKWAIPGCAITTPGCSKMVQFKGRLFPITIDFKNRVVIISHS